MTALWILVIALVVFALWQLRANNHVLDTIDGLLELERLANERIRKLENRVADAEIIENDHHNFKG